MKRFLEIGPGKKPLGPDWATLNITPPADFIHDARKLPYPIESESFELIYASHVLEHVPWYEAVTVLMEWRRLLRPFGHVEIWVSDFAKIVAAYHDPELADRDPWRRFNPTGIPMLFVLGRLFNYAGNPNYPPVQPGHEDPNWHRGAFDAPYLRQCLERAGFTGVQGLSAPRGTGMTHGRRPGRPGWIELGMGGAK